MGRMTSVGSVADEAVVVAVVVVVVVCVGDMAVVCHLCLVMLKRITPFSGAIAITDFPLFVRVSRNTSASSTGDGQGRVCVGVIILVSMFFHFPIPIITDRSEEKRYREKKKENLSRDSVTAPFSMTLSLFQCFERILVNN